MSENIEIDQNYGIPGRSKYPFNDLKIGGAFKSDDLAMYPAIRSAASRQGKALKKKFSVMKKTEKDRKTGIDVKKIVVVRIK